jgi:acetyltransferase-like isoleucine patch superfamily enzyme
MKKFVQPLKYINLRTIYFNLKYFPLKHALKLPVLISKNVYLKEVSGRIHFECPIRFGLIQIGYGNVGIFDKKMSRTIWDVSGDVTFCGYGTIGHGSKIMVASGGSLIFGDKLKISAEASFIVYNKIQIGYNCYMAWETLLMDTDFHKIKNEYGEIINGPKPIIIGDYVWIGCKCIILKGAVIPNNSVIAINSLVNKELTEENCLYAGSPVKCIKEKISWED